MVPSRRQAENIIEWLDGALKQPAEVIEWPPGTYVRVHGPGTSRIPHCRGWVMTNSAGDHQAKLYFRANDGTELNALRANFIIVPVPPRKTVPDTHDLWAAFKAQVQEDQRAADEQNVTEM